jgi:hypothetical protein
MRSALDPSDRNLTKSTLGLRLTKVMGRSRPELSLIGWMLPGEMSTPEGRGTSRCEHSAPHNNADTSSGDPGSTGHAGGYLPGAPIWNVGMFQLRAGGRNEKVSRHYGTTPAYLCARCTLLRQVVPISPCAQTVLRTIDCEWGVDRRFFHFTSRALARASRAALRPKAVRGSGPCVAGGAWWGLSEDISGRYIGDENGR